MAASRYELIAKLASGGMGSVFVGRVRGPLGFSRLVAIKRAHPHLVDDPTFVQMLVDEAKLASLIHHPHVVSVLDVERVKEQTPRGPKREIRLVMDYVEGLTLAEVATLADKRGVMVQPGIAIRALLDAGAGLQAAHELTDDAGVPLGIVHRDISPQNLIVGVDGMTRVSDFGIAKATMRPGATTSGALKGKLGYMAPEYVTSSALDARSDVFALGVVLWEALSGKKLFRGGNEVATLELVARCEVPRISEVRPEVGAALDDVMESALARDPDHRFGAARALVNALETAARRRNLVASHEEVAALVRELGREQFDKRRSEIRERVKELDSKALTGSTTEQQLRGAVDRAQGLIATEASSAASVPPIQAATPHVASSVPTGATRAEDATFGSGVVTPPARLERRRSPSRLWVWAIALASGLGLGALVVTIGFTPPKPTDKRANAAQPAASALASQSNSGAAVLQSPTITPTSSVEPPPAQPPQAKSSAVRIARRTLRSDRRRPTTSRPTRIRNSYPGSMGLPLFWLAACGLACSLIVGCSGCSDDSAAGGGNAGGGTGAGTTCTDCTPTGDMTFALPSPPGATVWTTTTMDKVLREAAPPAAAGEAIQVFAAKNELEAFQVAINVTAGGSVTLSLSAFEGPSAISRVDISRVEYVTIAEPSDASGIPSSRIPDPLVPTDFGASEAVPAGENQPFWVTISIPGDAAAGDYTANLAVTTAGGTADIPVRLHVFDFALPAEIGFDGNWNASMQDLGGSESLEKVEEIKNFFFDHRLVPSSVAWPAGLNYGGGIEYDCASGTFLQEDNPYDFSQLGPKYIDGEGWNGTGFPSFQIMQFVDNSTPRPQEFCGVDRGPDHFGTAAYNAEWSTLMSAIESYLEARGWQDKGYYYVQNEPQNEADYEVAAFLADLVKTAAPSLRIAVSEEPKPEIVDNAAANGASYDLWWANLSGFEPEYAATRQAAGEDVWWYFLYGDLPPHFNPITIDHPGIESRIAHWAAWKYRVKGFAYYSVTGWGGDPYGNPKPQGTNQNGDGFLLYPPQNGKIVSSIRWELLREGVEDFEYLKIAAGGSLPSVPGGNMGCDLSAESAVSSTTSFTHDTSALQHLRNELGAYLGGERDGCPELDSTAPGAHPRATYALNFQDPAGEPAASPLMVGDQEWLKIGWEAYDTDAGYGWAGPYIGDPAIMLYAYEAGAPVDELQKSIIFNDYGRTDTFNWDIENGQYEVFVSIGWYDRDYEMQRVVVEGQVLFDDVTTSAAEPYLVSSLVVDVSDGNVTLEVGQTDQYTMLNWMRIEPVD